MLWVGAIPPLAFTFLARGQAPGVWAAALVLALAHRGSAADLLAPSRSWQVRPGRATDPLAELRKPRHYIRSSACE